MAESEVFEAGVVADEADAVDATSAKMEAALAVAARLTPPAVHPTLDTMISKFSWHPVVAVAPVKYG